MPMDRSRYPTDWDAISLAVKRRADFRCEWCDVPHGAFIVRDKLDPRRYEIVSMEADMSVETAYLDGDKVTRVVLTVHHIGVDKPDGTPGDRHDKMDCRAENLVCLCQRCHLLADLDVHIANAAETRRRKRIAAGQMQMELGVAR